ncbi:hypothetical protein [Bacillus sp. V2I10]|uniref:hypothetical protein n=1 Tax=Bacillus sp. V2I10 TaxID=3042276 RepID=UPI00277DE002|nr:hypothetical protein [Bacillus sp. V2I10]MDQ0856704.1 hypothetical protein [Bacillus sp. V2I10]
MEIKIRNIDPIVVKKFDEMAQRKSISRQEFLKSILEKVAYEPEQNENEMRLEWTISKNIQVMEMIVERVDQLDNVLQDLLEE